MTTYILKPFSQGACALTLAVVAFGSAGAAPINYGDFSGATISYLQVTETANTPGDTEPLFGAPEIEGADSLDFDPSGFTATSTGGPLDITDGQLNFEIEAAPGTGLTSLLISEAGDFSFFGFGGVGTTASAGQFVRIDIMEVDNVVLAVPLVLIASGGFSSDMAATGGATLAPLEWSFDVLADFTTVLPAGFTLGVTRAEVVINNQLATNSEEDSLAFIAKKDFTITPSGVNPNAVVPEPGTLGLLALAGMMGGMMAVRQRLG